MLSADSFGRAGGPYGAVVEFGIPRCWRKPVDGEKRSPLGSVLAVRPDAAAAIIADGGVWTEATTPADAADQCVAELRESGADVEVLRRGGVDGGRTDWFAQLVKVRNGAETVQCHTFVAVSGDHDESARVVLRFVLSTTAQHLAGVAGDFQEFLSAIRTSGSQRDGMSETAGG